jgi:hypothetical protein
MMVRACAVASLVVLCGIAATGDGRAPMPQRSASAFAPPGVRTFLRASWKKTVVVEGALDSELLRPELIAAHGDAIYVYDYGDYSLKAFSEDGRLLWIFGRDGKGPGEFVNPTDLRVDRGGAVWLADPANSRVTVVSAAGRLVRTIQTESAIERIVPLAAGAFVGFAYAGDMPRFTRFDSLGRTIAQLGHPKWMDSVPSLVSELRVAASPDGRMIAVGSYYSGRLLLMRDSDASVRDSRAIEEQAFPRPIQYAPRPNMTVRRVPPEARPIIRGLTADHEYAYALVVGAHAERGRILDVYRLRDGVYQGSHLLPEKVTAIAMFSRGIAALVSDPLPALYYFERGTDAK